MEWDSITTETISNCWDHCFRGMPRNTELQKFSRDLEVEVEATARKHNVSSNRVGIQSLLNPAGEDAVLEDISLEALMEGIVSGGNTAATAAIEPAEVEEQVIHSTAKKLKEISITEQEIEERGVLSDDMRCSILSM